MLVILEPMPPARGRLALRLAAMCLVASLSLAAGGVMEASADEVGTDAPTLLLPPPPPDPSQPAPQATPDRLRCSTTGGYGYVRNEPNKYVIGNCLNGVDFYRARCNDAVCAQSFGYTYGNLQGCGWIASVNTYFTSDADHGHCNRGSIAISGFARLINCAPTTCDDGYEQALIRDCGMYANARPWTATSGLDQVRTRPFLYTVRWRYVSRDNRYVLVRDPGVAAGYGNWVFVQRDCLSPILTGYDVP